MAVDFAGVKWFKSTRSSGAKACVEIAFLDSDLVGVRDSKDPAGPALTFTPAEWDAFLGAIIPSVV